jgi:MFS transporter, SP family, general alpha glucoside:H+ symporter
VSIKRLASKNGNHASPEETLAMIERTVEIEAKVGGNPKFMDLWKGVDLRRTTITCLMYASQNFAGNLIANQATFFFERESNLKRFGKPNIDSKQRPACRPSSPSN